MEEENEIQNNFNTDNIEEIIGEGVIENGVYNEDKQTGSRK